MKKKKYQVHHFVSVVGAGLLIVFVLLNILASQFVSRLYFDFISGKKEAIIQFFRQARGLEAYQKLYPEIQGVYKENELDILMVERQRVDKIKVLEKTLLRNPQSRDVLYALAVLYEEAGNMAKAKEYREKAQSVDPLVVTNQ